MANEKQIFRGYFQNVDYTEPTVFLRHGEQTRLTTEILAVARQFNNEKDISTLREIFQWMCSNLNSGNADKFGRTVHDIVNSRFVTGCTDCGLVFVAFARAKGIPAVFVQSAEINWIKALNEISRQATSVSGHIFIELYINAQWYLVDSTAGFVYYDYDATNFSLPNRYYVFSKSIDVWDTGVKNLGENNAVMTRLFNGFDFLQYQKPSYKKKRLRGLLRFGYDIVRKLVLHY